MSLSQDNSPGQNVITDAFLLLLFLEGVRFYSNFSLWREFVLPWECALGRIHLGRGTATVCLICVDFVVLLAGYKTY